MFKLRAISLVVLVAILLASCGKSPSVATPTNSSSPGFITELNNNHQEVTPNTSTANTEQINQNSNVVAPLIRIFLEDAVFYLLGLQGSYLGTLTINDGYKTDATIEYSWEGIIGSGRGGDNMAGLIGLFLLHAYQELQDINILAGLITYANYLVVQFQDDGPEGRSQTIPYTQDLEFLAKLTYITGDPQYRDVAVAWFNNILQTSDEATDLADTIIDGRANRGQHDMAGWDIASAIRAALFLGQTLYAKRLAETALTHRRIDWDVAPNPFISSHSCISRSSLLWALSYLHAKLDEAPFETEIAEFSDYLLNQELQQDNGSYFDNIQVTAYAMIGLNNLPQTRKIRVAVLKAARYLLEAQNQIDGSIPTDTDGDLYHSQAIAEAIGAIVLSQILDYELN